jgi:uncharacterized protein (TIGR00106 family)
MSVIVDFSIFPTDKGASVSAYVAKAVKIVNESGLAHETGPMGTCIEGDDWDEVMGVIGRCFQKLKEDSDRVYLTMKVDYRKGPGERMRRKLESLEEKLG